ncbi:ROK family protein [Tengunoibacter tsumagoiensis]|uniref:Glucokinase n=1 Tax=Tengunoibacter tsumagoiensis TaxID=2014871 RepID=A0A402A2T8_9CHLR|nr:ROK family protein [Tengunoibacter tsumagoiensis]GCE13457.1 glucokinase [Tengunoibacter tsumagoiensis]
MQGDAIVLAFDMGGTRIKVGLVQDGQILAQEVIDVDARRADEGPLPTVLEYVAKYRLIYHLAAIGISIRGIIDPISGVILDVKGAYEQSIGQPWGQMIAQETGLPTYVENDARMYTLGELTHGAGRGASNLFCLTLGTGVGCGVVLSNRLMRGMRSVFGSVAGHITIAKDGPVCNCGNIGCLEALIGTAGLSQQAIERGIGGIEPQLPPTPYAIFAHARQGDSAAQALVDWFARTLGAGIVSLIHTYDPDIVIVGGGIMHSATQFLPAVQAYVDEHAWTVPRGRVRVLAAQLGDAAALIGVAELTQRPELLF